MVRTSTYYKGATKTRIDDIMMSVSLTRARCTGGYTVLGKEHLTNGSDHRSVVLHYDMESFLGMGPPRPPSDDVIQRVRAVTSALKKGELSRAATAYAGELEAVQKGNTGVTAVHKDNTVGSRAEGAERTYRKARKGEGDLADATNTLSSGTGRLSAI